MTLQYITDSSHFILLTYSITVVYCNSTYHYTETILPQSNLGLSILIVSQ